MGFLKIKAECATCSCENNVFVYVNTRVAHRVEGITEALSRLHLGGDHWAVVRENSLVLKRMIETYHEESREYDGSIQEHGCRIGTENVPHRVGNRRYTQDQII